MDNYKYTCIMCRFKCNYNSFWLEHLSSEKHLRGGDPKIHKCKNQNCDCGRKMTIIEEIVGRVEDTVIGLDGREMVRFHGIFVDMSKIIEGQIIQHTLNEFEIVLVSSEKLNEMDKDLLLKRMQSQLGQISLTITETDQIPRNQNGKFKSVISFVNRNK